MTAGPGWSAFPKSGRPSKCRGLDGSRDCAPWQVCATTGERPVGLDRSLGHPREGGKRYERLYLRLSIRRSAVRIRHARQLLKALARAGAFFLGGPCRISSSPAAQNEIDDDAARAKKERPTAADRSVAPIDCPEEREEELRKSPPGRSAPTVQR